MEHTPDYEKSYSDMAEICKMQEKYGIAEPSFKEQISELDTFQVVTPVVGKFSTGKSSLLNAVIGKGKNNRWYLGTNLTPETSVPTELCYGAEEKAILFHPSNEETSVELEDFIGQKYSVEEVKKAKLILDNAFLKEISAVKIVDMPGFDSGIELHNRAIDEYLPQSRAYILAFAATEPLIPESIANFLRELHLHEMPVYIVITKSQSVTKSQLDECVASIQANASMLLGLDNIEISCTNAKGRIITIEPMKQILRRIASDSQQVFLDYASRIIRKEAGKLIAFLRSRKKQSELAPSELAAQEETYQRQIKQLEQKLERSKQDFSRQTEISVANIKSQIRNTLDNSANSLSAMLIQRMDITYKVNLLVRESVISCIKRDFEPRLQRYMKQMANCLSVDVGDIGFDASAMIDESRLVIDSAMQETLKKSLPAFLSVIGISLTGPIGAVIGLVAGLFIDKTFEQRKQNAQRQAAENKVRNEIIPQVVEKAAETVNISIQQQMEEIHGTLEQEIQQQIDLHRKSLAATQQAHAKETEARQREMESIDMDLALAENFLEKWGGH